MPQVKSLSNQYYIYIRRNQEAIPWNIYDANPPIDLGLATYVSKILQAMEKSLRINDLVFYVTWDEIDELPSYGQNVVAVVLGDEWYRIPKYAHKVGAVFKCIGTHPILGCNPLLKPSHLNLLTLIQFLRILLVRMPGVTNYQFHRFKSWLLNTGKIAPIYEIPLGYNNSQDLPIKDIQKRLYDTYFSGSVVHRSYPIWSLKYWLGTPKTLARQLMMLSLKKIKEKYPDWKVELSITDGYHGRSSEVASSYSETMMNTKICVVPRGTSFETTRFFEAMKYGCIVVTEALPSRWYLDGSPAIQINDWRELEGLMEKLIDNQELMQEIHQESLKWWQSKCSETVVGDYMARELNALKRAALLRKTKMVLAASKQIVPENLFLKLDPP
jgi:hypothetical protein